MKHNSEYINVEEGLSRMAKRKKVYGKMLKMFLASEEIEKLDGYIKNGDISAAAESAHAIKGIAANLSLTVLCNKSTDLMNELRMGNLSEITVSEYESALKGTVENVHILLEDEEYN